MTLFVSYNENMKLIFLSKKKVPRDLLTTMWSKMKTTLPPTLYKHLHIPSATCLVARRRASRWCRRHTMLILRVSAVDAIFTTCWMWAVRAMGGVVPVEDCRNARFGIMRKSCGWMEFIRIWREACGIFEGFFFGKYMCGLCDLWGNAFADIVIGTKCYFMSILNHLFQLLFFDLLFSLHYNSLKNHLSLHLPMYSIFISSWTSLGSPIFDLYHILLFLTYFPIPPALHLAILIPSCLIISSPRLFVFPKLRCNVVNTTHTLVI